MDSRLKIQFSVQDVATERYVTFNDDVHPSNVREWFIRAALGVEQLFACAGDAVALVLVSDHGLKIPTIKLVREITGVGLKEAKDIVEGNGPGVGTVARDVLFLIENEAASSFYINKFKVNGIDVAIRRVDARALITAGAVKSTMMPPSTYAPVQK